MKIDIFSGFLGAGKTTLIKKLVKEAYAGERVVLIENEFGEIGIDGGFMQDAGINVTEMNSGCICCSLVGDFSKALQRVAAEYAPDRIIIEPSGVGKLSDVIKAVANADLAEGALNAFCTVVDAAKCKMYMKNFGEFFGDQVENASCILLSHTDKLSVEKLQTAVALLKEKNPTATIVTSSWDSLTGKAILAAMEQKDSLQAELERLLHETHCHEHHHEHHHGGACGCGREHHHEHGECDDPDCHCHEHHDHHEHHHEHHAHHHDGDCCCGHEHRHDHHADEVFTSWGKETARRYTEEEIRLALQALSIEEKYGTVLRAKGIVAGEEGWIHFDYVPGETDIRKGCASVTGRLCVIGCKLCEEELQTLFQVGE